MYEYFLWIFLRENRSLRLWNVAYLVEHMACTKFQKYAVPVRVCVSGVLCECTYSHPHPYAYLRDCLLKLIFCSLRPRRKSVNDTNNRRANGEMGKQQEKVVAKSQSNAINVITIETSLDESWLRDPITTTCLSTGIHWNLSIIPIQTAP